MAYKFLKSGAVGLVSGFRWPTPGGYSPGAWVEAGAPLRDCETGIHVCRAQDLPFWMYEELWAIEIEGDVLEGVDMLVASRGRLVHRMAGWTRPGQKRFVEACRDRAAAILDRTPPERRKHADAFMQHMPTYLRLEWTQLGALCAALAVSSTAGDPQEAVPIRAAYRDERTWQSQWLVDNLDLQLCEHPPDLRPP
jgi:hypothetical protein